MSNSTKPTVEILTTKEGTNPVIPTTPTDTVMKANQENFIVEYGDGHKLQIKRPNIVSRHYFPTLFGGEKSNNQPFMAGMVPLLFVESIDGKPVEPFSLESDILALLQELGDEGKDALDKCYLEKFVLPQMNKLEFDDDIKKSLLANI